jgi:hypothetical protein
MGQMRFGLTAHIASPSHKFSIRLFPECRPAVRRSQLAKLGQVRIMSACYTVFASVHSLGSVPELLPDSGVLPRELSDDR